MGFLESDSCLLVHLPFRRVDTITRIFCFHYFFIFHRFLPPLWYQGCRGSSWFPNRILQHLRVPLELSPIHYPFFPLSFVFPAISLLTPGPSLRSCNMFRDNFLHINCEFPVEATFFVPSIAAFILPSCLPYQSSLPPTQFMMSCANYWLYGISIEPNEFPFAGKSSVCTVHQELPPGFLPLILHPLSALLSSITGHLSMPPYPHHPSLSCNRASLVGCISTAASYWWISTWRGEITCPPASFPVFLSFLARQVIDSPKERKAWITFLLGR